MEKIAFITEFRDKLTDYLEELKKGIKINVYKNTKRVGVFVPPKEYIQSQELIRSYLEEKESVKTKSAEEAGDKVLKDLKVTKEKKK